MENKILQQLNSQPYLNSKELVYKDITLPKLSGLYFLYNRDYILMYIGQTKNLYSRMLQHLRFTDENTKRVAHNFVYVKYAPICEIEKLEFYEDKMINYLKPKLNKTGNYENEYNKYIINDNHPSNLRNFYKRYKEYIEHYVWLSGVERVRSQIDYEFYGIDTGIENRIF
jgi:excinuclease UvrABC nuclease subunit